MTRQILSLAPMFQEHTSRFFGRAGSWLERLSRRKAVFILAFFVLALLITIARRVETVTEPQFYAEDGVLWYAEAYHAENAADPFLVPKQGYYQTISRVGAWLSLFTDIQYAPLIFNLLAVLVTVLPALFFLMRFETLVPKLSQRLFLAFAYLLMPGSEVHANLTNAHWHLAILMMLVIIAPASLRPGWKVFDVVVLVIAGLSGPFVFFAFPIFMLYLYFRRPKGKLLLFAVLTIAFLVQAHSFLFIENDAPRSSAPLGATLTNFSMILGGNVFLKHLVGPDVTESIRDLAVWKEGILPVIAALAGLMLLGYFFLKAELEARLFVLFSFFVFAGCIAFPMAHLTEPQWQAMAGGSTGRYYYLPGLGWIVAIASLFAIEQRKALRSVFGGLLIVFACVAAPQSFFVNKYRDYHFREQVERFRSVTPGTSYGFKIIPGWTMTLVKKAE